MTKTLAVLVVLAAGLARAEDVATDEAKRRFELATRLYAQGNKEQALEEMQRVATFGERPAVLLNLVILYAELDRPEPAVLTADKLLSMKTTFDAQRLERVRNIRSAQRAKLGEVHVSAPLDGVELSIGGRALGTSPLAAPVLATAGKLVLAAKAPRHEPLYRELSVPAGGVLEIAIELKPTTVNVATVRVRCPVPGVDLFVDGLRVGTTPDVQKLAVMPGARVLSARRDGYRSVERSVNALEGGELEVELVPSPEPDAPRAEVTVQASEDQVTATVDGERTGLLGTSPLKLVPGPHLLVFERGGFYPVRRKVALASSSVERLELVFEPTPELRAELSSARGWHRLLGWMGVGVGAAGLAASAAYQFGYLGPLRAQAQKEDRALNAQADAGTGCFLTREGCLQSIQDARRRMQQADALTALGVSGFIVSGLALGAGIVSLVTTPDLAKYDRRPTGDFLQELGVAPLPGGGAALVASGGF
ncbi:MAG: hypothetical protein JNJ54_01620 [Myxococcaceae bacterium]|nr:hypothetical protein [Myxococcaceae bacterium]